MLLAQIATPEVDIDVLLPLLFLAVGGLLLLTVTSLTKALPRWFETGWTVAASVGAIITALLGWLRLNGDGADAGASSTLAGAVAFDGFSLFLTVVIAISVAFGSLLAHPYLQREGLIGPELNVLMLMAGAGGIIMSFSNDLIVFFVGLETLSMAVYILAAMHRRRIESQEAGMKYFILGSFSSAFLLYGIALLYGATGTTNLIEIRSVLEQSVFLQDGLLLGAIAFLIVGLAFKVGAVPFHAWTPDVYDGAPTPVVAFMASGIKAAGFAGFLRIMSVALGPLSADWELPVQVIAAATLLVGSISAIAQTSVKRMMAYSSISHAGFMLLGVAAASTRGTAATLFYIATYAVIALGTFGVLSIVGGEGDSDFSFDAFRGLARRRPAVSVGLLMLLLAQAGVPLTSGFFAKFGVIAATVDAGTYWLAAIAMMAAVIGAFLYLRLIVTMFLLDPEDSDTSDAPLPAGVGIVLACAVVITIFFGIFPGPLDGLAQDALAQLIG